MEVQRNLLDEALFVLRETEYPDNSHGEYAGRCKLCDAAAHYRVKYDENDDVQFDADDNILMERCDVEPHKPGCRLAAVIAGLEGVLKPPDKSG